MSQSLWNSFFIWEWMYSCVWIALWHRKFLSRNSSRRNAPEEPPGAIHSPIAMVGDRYGTWTRIGVGKSAAATVGTLNIAVCVNAAAVASFRPRFQRLARLFQRNAPTAAFEIQRR